MTFKVGDGFVGKRDDLQHVVDDHAADSWAYPVARDAFVGDLRKAGRARPVPDISHVDDLHLVAFHSFERAEIDTRSFRPDKDFLSDVLLHSFVILLVINYG